MKVKMLTNSNDDSDNDYLTELICVMEVEALTKHFEDLKTINCNQSLNETPKRLNTTTANKKRNPESSPRKNQSKSPPLPPSSNQTGSKRWEHMSSKHSSRRAETPSADRLPKSKKKDIPLDNVSNGAGRGRFYSNINASVKYESITQQVQNVLGDSHQDQRLMEMIRERTEQSRLATQNRISFQQVLEGLDKKLDKKAFIENWIYDCNKHLPKQKNLPQSQKFFPINQESRRTNGEVNPVFQQTERVVNSVTLQTERVVNSVTLQTERVSNSVILQTERVTNSECRQTERFAIPECPQTERFAIPECPQTERFAIPECQQTERFAIAECRQRERVVNPESQKAEQVANPNVREPEPVAKPELRKAEHDTYLERVEMERTTELRIMGCPSNPESQSSKCTDNPEPQNKKCTLNGNVFYESESAEITSNIEKENLFVNESRQSLTDLSVIENAQFSNKNLSMRTEHSKYFIPNCEWRPLDPSAYEFNISREFFPPLLATNGSSFNALSGSFSSNCFLPVTTNFIHAPLSPFISNFPIPIPAPPNVTCEKVLVIDNLPKTVLKKEVEEMFSVYGVIKEINIENTAHCCKVYLRADETVLDWIQSLDGHPVNFHGSETILFNIYYHDNI